MLDLDGFKAVNDTPRPRRRRRAHRHLRQTRCATACARPTSSARLGGDEFAVLLPAEGEAEAIVVAEAIVKVIREVSGVTASVGVTPFGDEPTTTSAMDRADMAMYAAKQAGRDRYEFTPGPLPATA